MVTIRVCQDNAHEFILKEDGEYHCKNCPTILDSIKPTKYDKFHKWLDNPIWIILALIAGFAYGMLATMAVA